MRVVSILRLLWRHRFLVAMGLAFALPIAVLTSYSVEGGLPPKFESRKYETGVASAAVLVDSKSSQVVDLGGGPTHPDVTVLSTRARLLANLMATSPLKDQIADRAGVRSDWVIGHPPPESGPIANRTPEGPSGTISEDDPRATVLRLHVNETLPIITADVDAPNPLTAQRIASAAIVQLGEFLKSETARAETGAGSVSDARKLVLSPLGEAKSATDTQGRGPLLGIALFVLVFGLWCTAIVGVTSLVRAWREAGDEREPRPAAPATQLKPPVARSTPPPPVRALPGGSPRELPERPPRARRAG